MALPRVSTGIEGLDRMLGGGFVERSANMVEGAPGTGKTTLGLQFLIHGAQRLAQPGLYISFEEFPAQLYADAKRIGWDLKELESRGLLKVLFTTPEDLLEELEQVGSTLESTITSMGVKRVVVDSLSHFEPLAVSTFELRDLEFRLVSAFKREGITAVLLRENANLLGDTNSTSRSPFVVDSFVILRYVEIDSAVAKALLVLKMRGSAHATDIRRYSIRQGGLFVEDKFDGREGILGGAPRKSKSDAFVEAFGRRH
jgi:circadian clock protein KaiC